VARRILVGSNGSPLLGEAPKVPGYMLEAQKCGYELNILDRVLKHKIPTPKKNKKKNGSGNGYATTSGQSSGMLFLFLTFNCVNNYETFMGLEILTSLPGSDGAFMTPKVVAEQGVDEILQMKFLESLVDTHKPYVFESDLFGFKRVTICGTFKY